MKRQRVEEPDSPAGDALASSPRLLQKEQEEHSGAEGLAANSALAAIRARAGEMLHIDGAVLAGCSWGGQASPSLACDLPAATPRGGALCHLTAPRAALQAPCWRGAARSFATLPP